MSDTELIDKLINIAKKDTYFYDVNRLIYIDPETDMINIHIDLICDEIMELIPDRVVRVKNYNTRDLDIDDFNSQYQGQIHAICNKYPNIQECMAIEINYTSIHSLPYMINMFIIECSKLIYIDGCENLKFLKVDCCKNLQYISNMPKLEELSVHYCESLRKIPKNITTLYSDYNTLSQLNLSKLNNIQNIHISSKSHKIPMSVQKIIDLYKSNNKILNIYFTD